MFPEEIRWLFHRGSQTVWRFWRLYRPHPVPRHELMIERQDTEVVVDGFRLQLSFQEYMVLRHTGSPDLDSDEDRGEQRLFS